MFIINNNKKDFSELDIWITLWTFKVGTEVSGLLFLFAEAYVIIL